MKTKLLLTVTMLLTSMIFAQSESGNYLITIGETKVGGYISLGGRYNQINSDNAGMLDVRAAITFQSGWAVGLAASGLSYDKGLKELAADGTYHLEAGYAGLFIEKIFSINEDFKFSASILMASGLTKYRYDKDYRKNKVWTEETIDETTFHVTEPSIELMHRISGNWWVSLTGGYRNTSPVEMIGTDEDIFRHFSGGVAFKYGVF